VTKTDDRNEDGEEARDIESDTGHKISRRGLLIGGGVGAVVLAAGAFGFTRLMQDRAAQDGWEFPAEGTFRTVEHEWIDMPDGVRLSVRLWIPEAAETDPVPVVLEYIPYRKRDLSRGSDTLWGETLASHGIAFARVDVRGSGESEGVMTDEYSSSELDDGVAIIDWLSRQTWSNGSVGMRGISWGAINTLQIATRAPAALKAIMPMSGQDDRFTKDAHYIGGTLGRTNFEWGMSFKQYMATPPDPEIVGDDWEDMWRERLEATPPILATWTDHQSFDDYWQRGSVGIIHDRVTVPTYVVGGLHEPYSDEVGRMLDELDVPRKGLLGPWMHSYPNTATPYALDWAYEEIRWWSHWLAGKETGIMDEPMLRAYIPYSTRRQALPDPVPGRWVTEDEWPTDRRGERLHLNAGGLSPEAASGPGLAVPTGSVVGQSHREWYGQPADEQSADDALSLTFDSEPLVEDKEILGYPTVRLRVTADKPVAQVAVRVNVVTEQGESWLVDYGILNLSHRESMEHPEALEPGKAYDVDVPLYLTSFRFPAGSRIRVAVSEGIWPMSWPSPEPVALTIEPGASWLSLPTRPIESTQAKMPIAEIIGEAGPAPAFPVAEPNAEGEIVITSDTPPYSYDAPDVGTMLSGEAHSKSTIRPGDPTSSVWEDSGAMGFRRGDWHCEVRSSYRLTADAKQLHLTETLTAHKDGEKFFERTHENSIPRRLL
jgi:putative CocE/NonD family hydrolase